MSLVSNFIGDISSSSFGSGIKNLSGLNMDDTTFSELLEKQINAANQENAANSIGNFGIPAGFDIQSIDGADVVQSVQPVEKPDDNTLASIDINKENDVTTSEAVTFFTSLLENNSENQNSHSGIFDFARKHATNLYAKGAGSVIVDLQEFVDDVLNS